MAFVLTLLEYVVLAARAVWPGALGAALLGYAGWSRLGLAGFVLGAALGAVAGTWAGAKLGLKPIPRMTGSARGDQALQVLGAFVLVGTCFALFQMAIVALVVAALALFALWFLG